MSGSSRSLLRAIDAVFAQWDLRWETELSEPVKHLHVTIDAYLERHNAMATVTAGLGDSLRACYNTHVKSSAELARDVFFVDILLRLVPVIPAEDISPWLHTYLRPALNSAGLDLHFVEKCRSFVLALSEASATSPDPELSEKRLEASKETMNHILRAYMGGDAEITSVLDLLVDEPTKATHEHVERLRFVEKNARVLLKQCAVHRPKQLFELLNTQFVVAASRQKLLLLLSQITSSHSSGFHTIMETPLFANLLRSLLYDRSESVLTGSLYVLSMLIAKVCTRVSVYVADLLLIVARLVAWSEFKKPHPQQDSSLASFLRKQKVLWDFADSDHESTMMQSQFFVGGEFNLLHLLTMLYALFPKHLILFSRSPADFWKTHTPRLITIEYFEIVSSSFPQGLSAFVGNKLKLQCRRFLVHPSILAGLKIEAELELPIKWILEANEGEDVGEDEVLLQCYQLNPDLMLTVPDNLILSQLVMDKLSGHMPFFSENWLVPSGPGSVQFSSPGSLRTSISLGAEETLNGSTKLNLPSNWETIDRRMSIVPTKLVMDHNKSLPQVEANGGGITFKHVNLGIPLGESLDVATLDEKLEPPKSSSITDLYQAHERLFTPNSSTQPRNEISIDQSPIATGSIQLASKTASDLLNKQLKPDLDGKESTEDSTLNGQDGSPTALNDNPGNALDFYQRELLLIKNEIEFSSYMKHLNKFNYLKLKLRLNRLLRDELTESDEKDREILTIQRTDNSYLNLMTVMQDAESRTQLILDDKAKQNAQLCGQLAELKRKIEEHTITIENLQLDLSESNISMTAAKASELELREELYKLQGELKLLQSEKDVLISKEKSLLLESELEPQSKVPTLDQHEKEIFDLKTEIRIYKDEQAKLTQALERANESLEFTSQSYEKQLTAIKLDKGLAVRELSGHYERKVQELSIAIAKFEAALDERNARITQLSTSKPISIPDNAKEDYHSTFRHHSTSIPKHRKSVTEVGGPDFQSGPTIHDYFSRRGNSTVSLESLSLSSNPSVPAHLQRYSVPHTPNSNSRQSSSQAVPIIRGRGGYQKRSKKVM